MIPSIGRIIHVCIGIEDGAPVLRPAIITRVWSPTCVNAQVFLDGGNDDRLVVGKLFGITEGYAERGNAPAWGTSLCQGEAVSCWQWPGRV